jgi:hypothetical protein
MFEIEKNVPIPEKVYKGGKGRKPKYPWFEMEVGDSFFVPNPPRQKNGHIAPITSVPSKRYAPKRFVYRKEGEGVRVWRVA